MNNRAKGYARALQIFLVLAALGIVGVLIWQGMTQRGTPDPTKIGKTQSHGCIRLTNWDALDLAARVHKGVQVAFLDG